MINTDLAELERLRERVAELETEKMMLRASMIAAVYMLVKWRAWWREADGEAYTRVLDMASDAEMWTREVAA